MANTNGEYSEKESEREMSTYAHLPGASLLRPSALKLPSSSATFGGVASVGMANNPFGARPLTSSSISAGNSGSSQSFMPSSTFSSHTYGERSHFTTSHRPFYSTDGPSSRVLLRPSALSAQTVNFGKDTPAKVPSTEDKENTSNGATTTDTADSTSKNTAPLFVPLSKGDSSSDEKPKNNNVTNVDDAIVKPISIIAPIVPSTEGPSSSTSATPESAANFVFGEHLAERVLAVPVSTSSTENVTGGTEQEETVNDSKVSSPTLAESAAAMQARLNRAPLKEVEVKTGEEGESNVFQVSVKLFLFDKQTQTWLEKGRGLLRLNDKLSDGSNTNRSFQSRLVMRTQGCLRVVLNSKIWSGMLVEKPNQKSVRFTAIDADEGVKVFLVVAQAKDAEQIYNAIECRVQRLRQLNTQNCGDAGSSETTQHLPDEAQQLPNSSESQHAEKRTADNDDSISPKRRRLNEEDARGCDDSTSTEAEPEVSDESCTSSSVAPKSSPSSADL